MTETSRIHFQSFGSRQQGQFFTEPFFRLLVEDTDISDDEFYLDEESLDTLEDSQIKPSIIEMLRHALGIEDSIQVTYEED